MSDAAPRIDDRLMNWQGKEEGKPMPALTWSYIDEYEWIEMDYNGENIKIRGLQKIVAQTK